MPTHNQRNDDGMALVTALLVVLLCTAVVTGILALATHTAQRSGISRDRQGALNAAQAGIQAELSLISDGSCPTTAGAATQLPDQNLPTESYIINAPKSCTTGGPAVISATGYVPNTTAPTATTTVVAHINRSHGAPVSGGTNGGYDFPDAVYTDGALSATNLNLFGSGGAIPNITANGAISISNSQIAGSVTGQGSVALSAATVGGNVAAGTNLTFSNTVSVTGAVTYAGTYSHTGTVNVSGTVTNGYIPPLSRPFPVFTNTSSDISSALGVGLAAVTSCAASSTSWTAGFYDVASSCASVPYAPTTYSTAASNGDTVIIVQGSFSVSIPPTATGGQLYVVDAGGGSGNDNLTITGNGSTLPVFAFSDGSLTVNGTLVGQALGHSVSVGSNTTMTFASPATPMADMAFPAGYTAPAVLTATGAGAFIGSVVLQYQCPGTTAC